MSQNFLKIYKSLKLLKRETFNEDKIKFKKMELVKENSILVVQNLKNSMSAMTYRFSQHIVV